MKEIMIKCKFCDHVFPAGEDTIGSKVMCQECGWTIDMTPEVFAAQEAACHDSADSIGFFSKIAENEETAVSLTMPELLYQFFTNYSRFIETQLNTIVRPPFLFAIIWIAGMTTIGVSLLNQTEKVKETAQPVWLALTCTIIFGGIIKGILGYWAGGVLYYLRVWLSGGTLNFKLSRYLNIYAGMPYYITGLMSATVVIIIIAIPQYFAKDVVLTLYYATAGITLLGMIYSFVLNYKGARLLFHAKPIRSAVFFIIVPVLFYALAIYCVSMIPVLLNEKTVNYNERGLELLRNKNYAAAEKEFNKSLDLMLNRFKTDKSAKNDIITVYGNLALLYEETGKTQLAIDALQKSRKYLPFTHADYHSISGDIHRLKDNVQNAVAEYEKALDTNPDNFNAHNSLGTLYMNSEHAELQDYTKALFHNKKAYELHPDFQTMENLATNYFHIDDFPNAIVLFKDLNKKDPRNAYVKFCMGIIYYVQKEPVMAKELLETAIKLDSSYDTETVRRIIKEISGGHD